MTIEELQKKLEDLTEKYESLEDEKDSLISKNKELIKEKRNLKTKFEDIDPEKYNQVVDELEDLKSNYNKLEKEHEKLNTNLSDKDNYLQKVLIEDGLTKSLLEAGIKQEFLKPAMAMLKADAKVNAKEDGYEALIGDKALNEFVPSWVNEGEGKIFKTVVPNSGSGASGGDAKEQNQSEEKTLKETYSEMFPN